MLTPARTKALEYADLAQTAANPNERRELRRLESSLSTMADNEKWLKDNHQKLVAPATSVRHPVSAQAKKVEDR